MAGTAARPTSAGSPNYTRNLTASCGGTGDRIWETLRLRRAPVKAGTAGRPTAPLVVWEDAG
jgi:hypothetical protein